MRFVLLSLSCFLLAGCTSVPSEAHREWASFRRVRVGMSREEVYALVGPSQQTAPCRNGIMHGASVEAWTGSLIVEQYRDTPAHMSMWSNEITAANAWERLGFAGMSRVVLSHRPAVAQFPR